MSTKEQRAMSRAEKDFRSAFRRLVSGRPAVLPKGTPVTQNNVAREAGKDPSALKKARFPELVAEIQAYLETKKAGSAPSTHSALRSTRVRNRKLVEGMEEVKAQRDMALSKVLSLQLEVLDLWQQLQCARAASASNVLPMKKRAKNLTSEDK